MRQLELERGLEAGSHGLLLPEPSGTRSIALGLREAQRLPVTAASPSKVSSRTDAKSSRRIAAAPVPAPLKTNMMQAKLQRATRIYLITMTVRVGMQKVFGKQSNRRDSKRRPPSLRALRHLEAPPVIQWLLMANS